jgi:NarL family two-component system response regulator LiaR
MDDKQKPVAVKKVFLIDDQILFREGLESLFQATPDFEMIGCAGTVFEGIEETLLHRPDIVLMDFSLPDGNGLDATRAILEHFPECKIVFLTVFADDGKVFDALRLGAKGYLPKNVNTSELLASLRALDRGEKAISRKMMSTALDMFSHAPATNPDHEKLMARLSPRELDVLYEIEGGSTNLEIANRLFLSENTVKHHIRNILNKLEVKNRREAAVIGKQSAVTRKGSRAGNEQARY